MRATRAQSVSLQLEGAAVVNFIVWLVVGGVIGWIASMIMRTDAQQGVILNVVVGIVGAALGGWLISPLVGVPSINQDSFSIGAMLVSLVGAIVLLAIVNLFRRGSVR
ncbi:MAG: GlsB/YeaQ/YmgE family stress response membrane protein [Pseudomonadota bacterium]|uniref:GlsB/YeaQ/YmgE family stress response membrane protein n=2 Tax=Caldimonas aquatica TaxID=376175 RepID=A0ABY6MUW7_9BURK|nr:GlsB/YeaQ/YmgE family stress response membrane protein [Schlegelella aquatica]UZD55802.1 GlsB/YeaQ/YmgE family stress response membrane protein [Schlegelella aquatica]